MKPIQIHVGSVIVGAAGLALILFTSSAIQSVQPADLRLRVVGPVQVAGVPMPQQMERVVTGTPLVVPAGKVFVATGLGFIDVTTEAGQLWIRFDGVQVLTVSDNSLQHSTGVCTIPPGLKAAAGTSVTVDSSFSNREAVLLGYLADA